MLSEEGQKQFALTGFRPVNTAEPGTVDWDAVGLEPGDIEGAPNPEDPFPAVPNLLTLDKNFGGGDWSGVADKFFGTGEDGQSLGIVTEAIAKSGKASGVSGATERRPRSTRGCHERADRGRASGDRPTYADPQPDPDLRDRAGGDR